MFKHTFPRSKTGTKPSMVGLDDFLFAMDTTLSWDGKFPEPGPGDFVVDIEGDRDGQEWTGHVLVSRRYTSANDHEEAGKLALAAYSERYGFETDDDGMPNPRRARVISVSKVLGGKGSAAPTHRMLTPKKKFLSFGGQSYPVIDEAPDPRDAWDPSDTTWNFNWKNGGAGTVRARDLKGAILKATKLGAPRVGGHKKLTPDVKTFVPVKRR
jgi:hypothetical protein